VNTLTDGYNSLIRPVSELETKVKVEVLLALIQIIDVVRMPNIFRAYAPNVELDAIKPEAGVEIWKGRRVTI